MPPRFPRWLAALLLAGCRSPTPAVTATPADPEPAAARATTPGNDCPAGSVARGAPPPRGRETWCEDSQQRRQGAWRIWDADAQLIARIGYEDGQAHGEATLLYADGTVAERGQHERGQRVGRWTLLDPHGRPRLESTYEPDGVVTERVFEPTGHVTAQWSHQHGQRHGTWTEHDDDGNLVRRELYEHGALVHAFVVREGREVEEPAGGMRIVVDLSPAQCPDQLPPAGEPTRRDEELLVLVLDKSGSMHGDRFEAVRAAVLRIGEALAPDVRLVVVMYDSQPQLVADSLAASMPLDQALAPVQAGGGTDLQPALELAARFVDEHARGRARLVVMTDGMFPPTCIDAWARHLRLRGATIDVAAIGDVDAAGLERIARFGGGLLRLVHEPGALAAALVELAAR